MQTQNIIERAFQLAPDATSIDEIRKVLRREGYSSVHAHLAGSYHQGRPQEEVRPLGATIRPQPQEGSSARR